jgi:hypothetical protein
MEYGGFLGIVLQCTLFKVERKAFRNLGPIVGNRSYAKNLITKTYKIQQIKCGLTYPMRSNRRQTFARTQCMLNDFCPFFGSFNLRFQGFINRQYNQNKGGAVS